MNRKPIFEGAASALVTPMNENGVDYPAFKKLIEWQIAEGIDALVIAGTSGEGSTLTDEEHREVLRFSVEVVAGRVPVIAGTGSNDTAYAIDLTKYACEVGPLLANWITDIKVFYFPELHFFSLSRWDILENTKVPGTLATYK